MPPIEWLSRFWAVVESAGRNCQRRGKPRGTSRSALIGQAAPIEALESRFVLHSCVIVFSSATYSVAEGQSFATITLARTVSASGAISVRVNIGGVGDTAQVNSDYQLPASQTVAWANGDMTSKTLQIPIVNDSAAESSETVRLTLSNPSGTTIGLLNTATLTITNDDTDVSVAVSPASVTEDGVTNLSYTFTRTGVTTGALTVNFGVSGTAAFNTDYAQSGAATFGTSSGTVMIPAGQSTASVTINPTTDSGVESNETVTLSVSTGTGYSVGSSPTATGTITNDDATLSVAAINGSQAEGHSGDTQFTFEVTRTGAASGAASVNYAVTGSGENPANAADFGGTFPAGTVSFAANETTRPITINVSGDAVVESDEGFTLTLSNPSAGATLTTATADGQILNDDDDTTASLTIVATDAVQPEGHADNTTLTFTVTRSGFTENSIAVNYSVIGSGTHSANAADFGGTFPSGTLEFDAGQSSQTILIDVTGDTIVEGNEGFTITLSDPTDGVTLAVPSADGQIRNDDQANLSINDRSDVEGASGTRLMTFNVTLNADVDTSCTVDFTTANDSATTANADYAANSGTLAFSGTAGETQTFSVTVNGDTLFEPDESFLVNLSNVQSSGRSVTLSDSQGVGTIENDDVPPFVFVAVDPSGQLTLTDFGDLDNNLSLAFDATTAEIVITSTMNDLTIDGVATNRLRIPASFVTNGLLAELGKGNDLLDLSAITMLATVFGGDGNDTLIGGSGNEHWIGESGNDSLTGGGGNDTISGGIGSDILAGGSGNDLLAESIVGMVRLSNGVLSSDRFTDALSGFDRASLVGGAGPDRISASSVTISVTLDGAGGNDTLTGGRRADMLLGGNENDSLVGGGGNDWLSGQAGDDALTGSAGDDLLDGGDESDRVVEFGNVNFKLHDSLLTGLGTDELRDIENAALTGGSGNNTLNADGFTRGAVTLNGGGGNDSIVGGSGDDELNGGTGADTLNGGSGADCLHGDSDKDNLQGEAGDDTLHGGASNDLLDGGDGDDVLLGEEGKDTLSGDLGDDALSGGTGNDSLSGNAGNDTILGGSGSDKLFGGAGNDTLSGGADSDTLFGDADTDELDGGSASDSLAADAADLLNPEGVFAFDFNALIANCP